MSPSPSVTPTRRPRHLERWRRPLLQRRLVLIGRCLLAGLCIAASVPPWGWWPLAFVGIAMLDRLIERMKRLPGVWFPTCEQVARHVLAAHPAS